MATPKLALQPRFCLHCDSQVAESRGTSSFCCFGCETVYKILHANDLTEYYSIRNRIGTGASPKSPALSFRKEDLPPHYDHLDDPDFLREYASIDPARGTRTMRFYLEGVHCAACVWLTEKLPILVEGVESLILDLSSGVATVSVSAGGKFAKAAESIIHLGYRPHPVKQGESETQRQLEGRKHLVQLGLAGMASGNIMLLAVALYAGADGSLATLFRWASFVLFLPVFFISARPFYASAWNSLRHRQVSIDIPIVFGLWMGTAVSVANLIAEPVGAKGADHIYFDSLSALVFLLLATRYLLRRIHQHALNSTQLMHSLTPRRAHKRSNPGSPSPAQYVEVPADSLKPGDWFRTLPGECFAADGVVISGQSFANCALLTGEAIPVKLGIGSTVNAGTWNLNAPVEITATASGAATRLGRIVAAARESQMTKAPIVTYLDRVGQVFVGAVILLTAIGFFWGLQLGWHEAVQRALAVAIIVCPCTFALATPLAFSRAIQKAAQFGIVIKNAEFLERLSHVTSVYLDKTGTVTQGELSVTALREIIPGSLPALFALENQSAHPIALAVQRFHHLHFPNLSLPEVEACKEIPGRGVSGKINGMRLEARSFEQTPSPSHQGEITTSIALYHETKPLVILTLSDQVRADSTQTVSQLNDMGLSVHLLSGDAQAPVQAVAKKIGIDPSTKCHWLATPETKAKEIRNQNQCLMVGDGANDAIALASAYTGLAVHGGMEISLQAAGAFSSQPGISSVPKIISVARETMQVIRRNLYFAIFYNIIGVAVAISGHLSPLFAALLMPASALTVYLSTLRGTKKLRELTPAIQRGSDL